VLVFPYTGAVFLASIHLPSRQNTFKVSEPMTHRQWNPTPPNCSLTHLSDAERRIYDGTTKKAVWNLKSIQSSLSGENPVGAIATKSASQDMATNLDWRLEDAVKFVQALSMARYMGSEWCYTPNGAQAFACDVYVMGFNRITGKEHQQSDPWVYFKFSMTAQEDKLIVFSAHRERNE